MEKDKIRYRKIIVVVSFALMMISTAFSIPVPSDPGELTYKQNCMRCHGVDGTRGLFGAKDLKQSGLPDSIIVQRIRNGKGIMPSFRKRLTPEEINQVSIYIKLLRND
jgi:cytochrome c6